MEKMNKRFEFNIKNVKQIERDGQKYGIIEGYASTYGNIDRVNDRVMEGAFDDSLKEYSDKNRSIPLQALHNTYGWLPIGKIAEARSDIKGLFVVAEVNLHVQLGEEVYSLAKQGVMLDFSIGYSIQESEFVVEDETSIQNLKKLRLWEISLVTHPANEEAVVTDIKTVVPFQNLPLADRKRAWSARAAIRRVRTFTDSTEEATSKYKKAFFWYDSESPENFGSYKLPYADVVNGKLTAIPRGVFAAAAAIQGARGGVNIPEGDVNKIKKNIEKYYAKMRQEFDDDNIIVPWKKNETIDIEMYEGATMKEIIDSWESIKDIDDFLEDKGLNRKERNGVIAKIKRAEMTEDQMKSLEDEGEPNPHKDTKVSESLSDEDTKEILSKIKTIKDMLGGNK